MFSQNQKFSILPSRVTTVSSLLLSLYCFNLAQAATIDQRITSGSDDAEETASGSINTRSSDLELVVDKSNQTVGLRFSGLAIPQGALIQNAYIQFEVDETKSAEGSLNLHGERTSNAPTFTANKHNISNRIKTSAQVGWAPPAWPEKHAQGADQRTPDITAIIQEIVNQPAWNNNHALAIIITGSGTRTAESFDGKPAGAPLLHIEFVDDGTPDPDNQPPPINVGSDNNWRALDLSFNGTGVGVDSSNKLLLLSLPTGFATPQNYTATLQYGLEAQGFSLTIDNGSLIPRGSSHNFGSIGYGSIVPVQLYQNGNFSESYSLIFTNLPVIELNAEHIVDEPKNSGTFRLFSGEFSQATGNMNMGIEFRGATSQRFPKKSFSLELVKIDDPEDELKIKLLNLRKDGDWILDASYRDTTFVRNLISHDIYRDIRPFAHTDASGEIKGQSTIAGQLVEVILNEAYHGAYVLEEKIDRKLLGLKKIKPPTDASGNELWQQVDFSVAKNNSVLYKADSNKADLHHPSNVRRDFEQKYPKPKDVKHWKPLEDLADFIANTTDTDFVNGIDSRVDIDSVVDYWILTLITSNKDTLKKNYYLARNQSSKFFIVPWDYDATFGMLWNGSQYSTTRWWNPDKNNLIRRLSKLSATGFNSKVKDRWNALRNSTLTRQALITRFEGYIDQLQPVAGNQENAHERNLDRWPDSGGSGVNNPELGTTAYIDNWIQGRLIFLDRKIAEQAE